MANDPLRIQELFKGEFLTDAEEIASRLSSIRAFLFDWDGVFNNGVKQPNNSSSFSEIDSMGTNMLRFSHYLRHGTVPYTAIITGEQNEDAVKLAGRECFDAVYTGIKHKQDALLHLRREQGLEAREIAFMFDDVLDLSVAGEVGLRFMVGRQSSPMLTRYTRSRGLADYVTAAPGSGFAVREVSELLISLNGNFDETISNRVAYSDNYRQYLSHRNANDVKFYTLTNATITLQ